MTTKIQIAIRQALRDAPNGLSINELSEVSGFRGTSVRRTISYQMPDVYIVEWREQYRCRPTAIYKAAYIPEDAPEPPPKPANYHKNKARSERAAKPAKKKAEPKKRGFTSTGLTTIRGPWPVQE